MTTPTANESNAATTADKTALQNAANTYFIDQATTIIADFVAQGKYQVSLDMGEYVDTHYIVQYFRDLGYGVDLPNLNNLQVQPADLFGHFWVRFWNSYNIFPRGEGKRITISWRLNTPGIGCP